MLWNTRQWKRVSGLTWSNSYLGCCIFKCFPAIKSTHVKCLCRRCYDLLLQHFLPSTVGIHFPVFIRVVCMSRALMTSGGIQIRYAHSSQVPGHTSGFHGSMNVQLVTVNEHLFSFSVFPIWYSITKISSFSKISSFMINWTLREFPFIFTSTIYSWFRLRSWEDQLDHTLLLFSSFQINYDAGSHSHTYDWVKGAQFFITPNGYPNGADDVTISYDVLFDPNFDFVLGGRLPGTWGYNNSCSGGRNSSHCLSTRFKWRPNGQGELYLYFPKNKQLHGFSSWSKTQSSNLHIIPNGDFGVSFQTSDFVFRTNHWTNMKQQVHLNSFDSNGHARADGWIKVWFDGSSDPTFTATNMVLRSYSNVHIDGVFFSTFFGGQSKIWATPHDTYTLYKNFHIQVNHLNLEKNY